MQVVNVLAARTQDLPMAKDVTISKSQLLKNGMPTVYKWIDKSVEALDDFLTKKNILPSDKDGELVRFDYQGRVQKDSIQEWEETGTYVKMAIQQNGKKGSTNLLEFYIQDIAIKGNIKQVQQRMLEKMEEFEKNYVQNVGIKIRIYVYRGK